MRKSHVNAYAYGFIHIGGYSQKTFMHLNCAQLLSTNCSVADSELNTSGSVENNWPIFNTLKQVWMCGFVRDELTDERSPVVKFKGAVFKVEIGSDCIALVSWYDFSRLSSAPTIVFTNNLKVKTLNWWFCVALVGDSHGWLDWWNLIGIIGELVAMSVWYFNK